MPVLLHARHSPSRRSPASEAGKRNDAAAAGALADTAAAADAADRARVELCASIAACGVVGVLGVAAAAFDLVAVLLRPNSFEKKPRDSFSAAEEGVEADDAAALLGVLAILGACCACCCCCCCVCCCAVLCVACMAAGSAKLLDARCNPCMGQCEGEEGGGGGLQEKGTHSQSTAQGAQSVDCVFPPVPCAVSLSLSLSLRVVVSCCLSAPPSLLPPPSSPACRRASAVQWSGGTPGGAEGQEKHSNSGTRSGTHSTQKRQDSGQHTTRGTRPLGDRLWNRAQQKSPKERGQRHNSTSLKV